jgi:FKBP-type peptidyl-prolyl cis-trans isomerase
MKKGFLFAREARIPLPFMRVPKKTLSLMVLALGGLLLGACSQQPAEDLSLKASAYRMSAADQKLVAEKFPGVPESASGLRSVVLRPGTGTATPRHGTVVKVKYELRNLDGIVLESSEKDNKGEPLVVPIGVGRVIKAWDEAVMEMKKGEKRTIVVPHWIGYGVTGNPPKIPPYSTLVFDIELLDF